MGTLYDQPVRWDHKLANSGEDGYTAPTSQRSGGVTRSVEEEAKSLMRVANRLNIPLADVIAIKHMMVLDRANNLRSDNSDIWDEQIGGIGEEISRIGKALESIAEKLHEEPPGPISQAGRCTDKEEALNSLVSPSKCNPNQTTGGFTDDQSTQRRSNPASPTTRGTETRTSLDA
jgi:hypothetical protein